MPGPAIEIHRRAYKRKNVLKFSCPGRDHTSLFVVKKIAGFRRVAFDFGVVIIEDIFKTLYYGSL